MNGFAPWIRPLAVLVLGLFAGGPARAADLALVRGEFTERDNPVERNPAAQAFQTIFHHLTNAGVSVIALKDSDVVAGRLEGCKLAIFPYSTVMPEAEVTQLLRFLDDGGKLIAFYALPPRLAARWGVKFLGNQRADADGQFASMKFRSGLVAGIPALVRQSSWNISLVKPVTSTARVLAEWQDRSGKSGGAPAWILTPEGAWMSHVLLAGDSINKQRLLLAVAGHFAPRVWERSAYASMKRLLRTVAPENTEALARQVQAARLDATSKRLALRALRDAERECRQALVLTANREYVKAVDVLRAADDKFRAVRYRLQPSQPDEFRGVWIHSGSGVEDWGWDKTVRVLKDSGFSALFPNLLWGGLAHYPSQVLPASFTARTRGDQVAECLKACRKYGVELHVWKVNYSLTTAPAEFLNSLRSADRTQKSRTGEDIDWLCPSHPDNVALERDSLLEVVRRYDVDGLHFDYIRYPHANACYCQGCRLRFSQSVVGPLSQWPEDVLSGGPLAAAFADWRRGQISQLVRAVSEEARRLRPGIKISAAVFGDWPSARNSVGQDARAWIQAGYLDFVCPMNYEPDDRNFSPLLKEQVRAVQGRIPVYPGIGAFRLNTPEQVIRQIQLARELGASGFLLFQYDAQLAQEILPALKVGTTAAAPALSARR